MIKAPEDLVYGEVFDFGGQEYVIAYVVDHGADMPVEVCFYDPEDEDCPIQTMHLGHQIKIVVSPGRD